MSEHGDKISDSDKSTIEAAIADLKTALEGDDAEEVTAKTQALTEAAMKLGEAMYQAQQSEAEAAAAADAAADAADGADDVVDADFEEVSDDDDKKKSA